MTFKIPFALIALSLFVCACSNEQVYTAIQNNRQLECQKLPQTQYEQCMKNHDQSYDSYARYREDRLENGEQN